jgi:hypothetical protein
MNFIRKDVFKIIDSNFIDEGFFQDKDDFTTEIRIRKNIERFSAKYPDLLSRFLSKLKTNFPNAVIDDCSQLFSLDRCLRIRIKIDENTQFICQISIFEFFSVYSAPVNNISGIEYQESQTSQLKFIDPDEDNTCDRIYECLIDCNVDFIWLKRGLLEEVIPRLSESDYLGESFYDGLYVISVGCVLFTKFYG